jgi:hypothetical protein
MSKIESQLYAIDIFTESIRLSFNCVKYLFWEASFFYSTCKKCLNGALNSPLFIEATTRLEKLPLSSGFYVICFLSPNIVEFFYPKFFSSVLFLIV